MSKKGCIFAVEIEKRALTTKRFNIRFYPS